MKEQVAAIPTRTLGRTGLEIKMLGVGGISPQNVVERALAAGLNFFDVHGYKGEDGSDNRERFRRAFAVSGLKRSDVVLTARAKALSRKGVLNELDETLDMLGIEYLDVYGPYNVTQAAGRVEQALAPDGALAGLREAKAIGKIRHIGGVSGHHHNELVQLLKTDAFDAVMVAVNVFDQDVINTVLPVTKAMNIGTIAMKPFAKGIFTANPQAALWYVYSQGVSVAVPGMMTIAELEENIRITAGFTGFTADDAALLKAEADATSKAEGMHICRQCGYCVPVCPQKIDIKDLFYMERQASRYYSIGWAKEAYAKVAINAEACVACGACEAECPYDLPIREMLKKVHTDLK